MKVAVFSDVHGNRVALDRVMDDIRERGVDRTVCLGDAIQGGAQPRETVDALRRLACPVVMGNADAWLLDEKASRETTSERQRAVREWTVRQISPDGPDFIRSFQPTIDLELGGGARLLCFHGSPSSFDDILLPDTPKEEWERLLGPRSPAVMAGGHTHTQQVRRVGTSFYFNPGSVGAAYNHNLPEPDAHSEALAEYALLTCDGGNVSVEFRRIRYDLGELTRAIASSGRPGAEDMISDYRSGAANWKVGS